MRITQLIIMAMFDVTEYIILSKKMFEDDKILELKTYINIVIFSFIAGLNSYFFYGVYRFTINAVVIIIMISIMYRRRFIEKLYVYLINTIIILIIQTIFITIIGVYLKHFKYLFINGLICQMLSLIMIILIYRRIPVNTILQYVLERNKIFSIILLNLLIMEIFLLFYWYVDFDGFILHGIFISFISICSIFVNFIILKSSLLNNEKEKQIQIYNSYFNIIENLIDELRCRQHEYDNHIQTLEMIIVSEETYKKSKLSIEEYINGINKENYLGDLIKLNNKVLLGFLYNKKKEALKKNIEFEIKIIDYNIKTKLKDFEIIEVIGVLINNAFETQIQNNVVKIIFNKEKNMNVIEVINKHPYLKNEIINSMFTKNYSTKQGEGRGLGLYNLKKLVGKYHGTIEVLNKQDIDNWVVFRVLVE